MKIKAVPKAAPTPLLELETYLQPFIKLFRRSWSRQSCERYITGLLTDLPHKNCETIAAALAGTSTERLQHLLTDAGWDALALHQLRVQHLMFLRPKGGWRELPRHALSYENLPFSASSMYVPTTFLFSVLRDLDLARLLWSKRSTWGRVSRKKKIFP
jgi:hypothetical protein